MAEFPRHIVTPDGEVTLASARDEFLYNNFKFASARKAGNVIYVSGVIAGPEKGEGRGVEDFMNQLRRAFGHTFHIWASDNFQGDKNAQLGAFIAVKDEFMPPPHPAWTAVGTTGLALDTGVVEIQAIAHV
jgi:enamine deaminase RidA (YjgF/YER057c/UK114 family)